MPPPCSICKGTHQNAREAIDAQLVAGRPLKLVAREASIPANIVRRHRDAGHHENSGAVGPQEPPPKIRRRKRTPPPSPPTPVKRTPKPFPPPKPARSLRAPIVRPPVPNEVRLLVTREQRITYLQDLINSGQWEDHVTNAVLVEAWPDMSRFEITQLAAMAAMWGILSRGPRVLRRLVSIAKTTEIRAMALEMGDPQAALRAQAHLDRLDGLLRPEQDGAQTVLVDRSMRLIAEELSAKYPDAHRSVLERIVKEAFREASAVQLLETGVDLETPPPHGVDMPTVAPAPNESDQTRQASH